MSRLSVLLTLSLIAALTLAFGWILAPAAAVDTGPDEIRPPPKRVSPQTAGSFTASSNEPGVVAQYTITFTATADYTPILHKLGIKLEGFSIPTRVPKSAISIKPDGSNSANARSVAVAFDTLIIDLPDFDPATDAVDTDADKINAGELVTVTIQSAANIRNPIASGSYPAVISGPGNDLTTGGLIIHRVIKLDRDKGSRGIRVTATGKGFENGASLTFFLDTDTDGMRDQSESILCQAPRVGGDNTGSCDFTVTSPPFTLGDNYVNGIDGSGQRASAARHNDQKFTLLPDPTPTPPLIVPGNEPPHLFSGRATLNGNAAGPGVVIAAYDGDRLIGATVTQAGGRFTIQVHQSNGIITFRVNQQATAETWQPWQSGQVNNDFTLTAGSSQAEADPARLFRARPELVRAFSFDNRSKEWSFFDPAAAEVSALTRFVPQQPYWLLVSQTTRLLLNGVERELFCVEGNCWNLIVW